MPVRVARIEGVDLEKPGNSGAPVLVARAGNRRGLHAFLIAGADVGVGRVARAVRGERAGGASEGACSHHGDAGDAHDGSGEAGGKRAGRAPRRGWHAGPANQPPHWCAHCGEPPTPGMTYGAKRSERIKTVTREALWSRDAGAPGRVAGSGRTRKDSGRSRWPSSGGSVTGERRQPPSVLGTRLRRQKRRARRRPFSLPLLGRSLRNPPS